MGGIERKTTTVLHTIRPLAASYKGDKRAQTDRGQFRQGCPLMSDQYQRDLTQSLLLPRYDNFYRNRCGSQKFSVRRGHKLLKIKHAGSSVHLSCARSKKESPIRFQYAERDSPQKSAMSSYGRVTLLR
ncbi:hypothetical protein EVAR_72829_1 [Eumeta japonica]|uniref:Uncharacterized protein n=1 Tax=Eumeta variegata TaxID=151549 RepID=A0A4C1T5C3_EUMVA|nr:hypothetical protein EVAR_72829_1 [Eumeta japonica]